MLPVYLLPIAPIAYSGIKRMHLTVPNTDPRATSKKAKSSKIHRAKPLLLDYSVIDAEANAAAVANPAASANLDVSFKHIQFQSQTTDQNAA